MRPEGLMRCGYDRKDTLDALWGHPLYDRPRRGAVRPEEILKKEGFDRPVIVGQSMGGYVGQAYAQLFPEKLRGFVSIDSAP
ncbi:MAG: alpha/beta hydrolase, partial [Firmicutes bacterium]|nr:alpha/beta hydrolase [Bacillota bacterium]